MPGPSRHLSESSIEAIGTSASERKRQEKQEQRDLNGAIIYQKTRIKNKIVKNKKKHMTQFSIKKSM